MARKRMIDPEFWSDEKIGMLSFKSRLLFIGMWNFADDEGLIRFSSAYLKSMIFPYDDISLNEIEKMMQELHVTEFVFPYIGGLTNQKYCYIVNFLKHQRIDRPQPSKLPAPSLQSKDVRNMYFRRDGLKCHICNDLIDLEARHDLPKSKAPSLDHIKPRSKGGSDYPSNIKTSHIHCNKSKCDEYLDNPQNESSNDSSNESENHSRLIEYKRKEEKRKEVLSGKPDLAAPIVYLNKKASRQFDPSNKSNQDLVKARFNEGRTFEDFTQVIDKKCSQWLTDPKMMHYLRPETLFSRSHFESYLNEPERKETSAERDARILAKFK